tara:strand:- start:856 stop:1305 length:450 start_codon:yes stop_codon:yes gene_type:complete
VRSVDLKWLRRVIGAGLITLLLPSCGAKYHLKRAIAKDPTILESVAVEVDTTIITENKAIRDTLILQRVDTITLERNAVRVKIRRIHDTIQIDAECLPDTIRIQKVVNVPQVIYKEAKPNNTWKYIFSISFFFISIALLLKYIYNIFNK